MANDCMRNNTADDVKFNYTILLSYSVHFYDGMFP